MIKNNQYDIAIVGGGIHGAGVAQAAQAGGYSCVLIEQTDWAAGTSSKSSKLIHGGLRYLETAQIGLVWHSLMERKALLRLAPQLVKPCQFLIPVYPATSRRPWQLQIGLNLYALLAGFTPLARFHRLDKAERSLIKGLNQQQLQQVFQYWDGQTDDRELTRAVVASARELGLTSHCPAELLAAKRSSTGYTLTVSQRDEPLHCKVLINAAGPWVNQLLTRVYPQPEPLAIDCVKGSHLVLAEKISDQAFYLEAPMDRRAVFVLPWHDRTLVGTTEQIYTGSPEAVAISEAEEEYLLATVNAYFPDLKPTVIERFAGLRVLPRSDKKPFFRPRDCIIHSSAEHPNVISLYGGKLTSFRHTAKRVIDQIQPLLGRRKPVADIDQLPLLAQP